MQNFSIEAHFSYRIEEEGKFGFYRSKSLVKTSRPKYSKVKINRTFLLLDNKMPKNLERQYLKVKKIQAYPQAKKRPKFKFKTDP